MATVLLSKPPLNILSLRMMQELDSALAKISHDLEARAVVLRSGLDGVFSAGADVREHLPENAEELISTFERLVSGLVSTRIPTVAVVEGKCLGGGMELAMACDFVIANEDASFGQPEVKVGVYPPVAAALYPKIAGPRNTLRILLTGETFSAKEAHSMGFATLVVKKEEIQTTLEELLKSLGSNSRTVLELTKRAIGENLSKPASEAIHSSSRLYLEELMKTEDAKEGLTAFLEKRKPSWRGR